MSADPPSPSGRVLAYHEASKHRPERYAPGPGRLDWATQPDAFREYAGAPRVELPLSADTLATSFADVRRGVRPAARTLDRDSLATLLELSLGLSAWKAYGGSRWALRCNPSSGNLHPTEGYVVCGDLPGLAAGVHHYVSRDHALEARAAVANASGGAVAYATADGDAVDAAKTAARAWNDALRGGVLLGLTGIHWREAWKYGLRAYRYCQHDCGHAIAAIAYAAAALGWRARVLAWPDATIAGLLGIDRDADFGAAEREAPETILWIDAAGAPDRTPEPPRGVAALRFAGTANRLSRGHVDWPGIDEVDAAALRPARADSVGPHDMATPPSLPLPARPTGPARTGAEDPWAHRPPAAVPTAATAATLIRQRRSAVDFDGTTRLPAPRFFAMLDALLPRAGVPPLDAWPRAPRVHPVLFVHRVDDLAPGLYVLVRAPDALPRLRAAMREEWAWSRVAGAPGHLPLHLLVEGDARDAARSIACHQDIAADSCFAVGFLAGFDDALLRGGEAAPRDTAWAYRELFWETGILGQILYLEAEAAGIRGTGIGCFFDDSMHALLGLRDGGWQSLYHFTAGGPREDRRLQTHPPYAHLARGGHVADA